jgi:dTDP-4-dehydrorhamnose 3,5-epimerase
MIFTETTLVGAYVIEPERFTDERGFFARAFDQDAFAAHGLNPDIVQCNISYNRLRGTLRGMHFQAAPHAESKLIRCTAGAVYDVIVDLRPGSLTFRQWFGVELSADNRRLLYVPEGLAHGLQTLAGDTEVFYQMGAPYVAEAACGVRYNDPAFGIDWPLPVTVISARDRDYEDFRP